MRGKHYWVIGLIVYVFVVFYIAVLGRDTLTNSKDVIRTDLLKGFLTPTKDYEGEIAKNIICFIPIGIFTSIITKKYRILKALLIGFLFSLTIESSQLIWKKGIFDVFDLFNNIVGALIGGVVAVMFVRFWREKKILVE